MNSRNQLMKLCEHLKGGWNWMRGGARLPITFFILVVSLLIGTFSGAEGIPTKWWALVLSALVLVSLFILWYFNLTTKVKGKYIYVTAGVTGGALALVKAFTWISSSVCQQENSDGVIRIMQFNWCLLTEASTWTDVRVLVIALGLSLIGCFLFIGRDSHGKWHIRLPKVDDVWRGSFASAFAVIAYNIVWAIGELSGNVDTFTPYALNWVYVGCLLILAVIVWPLAKDKEWARRWTGFLLIVVGIGLMLHLSIFRTSADLPSLSQFWDAGDSLADEMSKLPTYPLGVKVTHLPGLDVIELAPDAETDPILFNEQIAWDGKPGGDGHFIKINGGGLQWVATDGPDVHLTARGQIQFVGGPNGSTVFLYPPHRMHRRLR